MAQISKYKLDKDLELELYNQFWHSLSKVNNSQKSSEFFSDILTSTEKLMLAKRLAAAVLLLRGRTVSEIKNSIHLAYSTIGTIAAWLKNARPSTKRLLESISREKSVDALFDKIDSLLGIIPPRRHSDWKEEYAKRISELSKSSARKTLR